MKMLVVVDYQNDFVNGALGFPGAEKLEDKIVKKIKEYRANGDIVVFTYDTHHSNYLETREGKTLPIPHCIEGTDGWKLYGMVQHEANYPSQIHIKKSTFGVSPEDMLKNFEHMKNVDQIEFVGLVTNMCVISNVACFQAMWPDAQIMVNPMMVDSFDKSLHQKSIDVLRGMQVTIVGDK